MSGLADDLSRICGAEEALGATVSISALRLSDGLVYRRRADARLPSASVIKVGILGALYAAAERAELELDELRTFCERDRVPGSGVLNHLHAGLGVTLSDLAHLMITVSDNTASNMLIDRLGCAAVNEFLVGAGCRGSALGRKFYDFEARDRGLDNWAVADEFTGMLASLAGQAMISPVADEAVLAVMKKQQFTGRIPALLPEGTVVANKTGSITGICHDAGVIYTESERIVLSVFTQGVSSPAEAEGLIRRIALTIHNAWGCAPSTG